MLTLSRTFTFTMISSLDVNTVRRISEAKAIYIHRFRSSSIHSSIHTVFLVHGLSYLPSMLTWGNCRQLRHDWEQKESFFLCSFQPTALAYNPVGPCVDPLDGRLPDLLTHYKSLLSLYIIHGIRDVVSGQGTTLVAFCL